VPVTFTLGDVLALASRDGRICPRPSAWARLYELLPDTRRDGYGFIPAAPFILEAWSETGDQQKHERFVEHLNWAESHGALARVHAFLAELSEEEWHHAGERAA
jgi:hypothetical protein